MLDLNELLELEENLRGPLFDNLEEILINLNRTGKLEEFVTLVNMPEMLGIKKEEPSAKDGIIIVIGYSDVEEKVLSAVAKGAGIGKERIKVYLNFEDPKTFDFKKTQWSTKYSCILVGPMPHSGKAKGDYSSVITALESQDGYPPVVRMGANDLKITKSSFRDTIKFIINEHIINNSISDEYCYQ